MSGGKCLQDLREESLQRRLSKILFCMKCYIIIIIMTLNDDNIVILFKKYKKLQEKV